MDLDVNIVNALAKHLGVDADIIIAQPLNTEVLVSDTTQKFLICTGKNTRPKAFVLISAKNTPVAIKSGYEKLCGLAERIGPELAKNLLMPLAVAESNGLTYSISRYHPPLSNKFLVKELDFWKVRRPIINWVIGIARATKTIANKQEIEQHFMQPLLALSQAESIKSRHQKIILEAVEAIKNERWQPSFVCAHNDLWWGNVLTSKQHQFVLVDWDGVLLKGFAFYDLVRAASSFELKKTAFKKALQQYCSIMECNELQAKYYLISAIAYLHSDLGGWQYERFITLLEYCMDYLQEQA